MNRRLAAVFVFALVVASITSFGIYRLIILRVQQTPARAVPTGRLVVAARNLQVGELIRDSDLNEIPWSGAIPAQALKTRQDAIGRGVIAPIYQDEPILEARLAAKGAGAGLAAIIPIGMRAVALRVNEVVGLAGFVLPGMRVDVLIAGNAPGATDASGTVCRTVLQNIEVLSAGQRIEKNADGKPESVQVVNLLVTPEQAEVLDLASDDTKVQLVLRNPLDTKDQDTPTVRLTSLFGQSVKASSPPGGVQSPPAAHNTRSSAQSSAARTAPQTTVVEVFNGNKKSEATFQAHR
jgi:pilus assembly protein CpaB